MRRLAVLALPTGFSSIFNRGLQTREPAFIAALLVICGLFPDDFRCAHAQVPDACDYALQVPQDFDTIQLAIHAATDGDCIEVEKGIYFENLDLLGKDIYLMGTSGAEYTVVDGGDLTLGDTLGCVIYAARGESANYIIDGFTFSGGIGVEYTSSAGGVYRYGGGAYIDGASPTLRRCQFRDNSSSALFLENSHSSISDCEFVNNTSMFGAGLQIDGESSISVVDTTFHDNIGDVFGGGILVWGDEHSTVDSLEVRRCTFTGNNGGWGGGGIAAFFCDTFITHCSFDENHASIVGGGICLNAYGTVHTCEFKNGASAVGGGVYLAPDGGDLNLTNSVVVQNVAFFRGGGVVLDHQGSHESSIHGCTIADNAADIGAGIALMPRASGGTWSDWVVPVTNSIICQNAGGSLDEGAGAFEVTYSDVEGGADGIGNIERDPLFVDESAGDYSLAAGSPCVDAGDPNAPYDADGTRADMGADLGAGAGGIDTHGRPWGYVIDMIPEPMDGFTRGDFNGDGVVSALLDANCFINWYFADYDPPTCMDAADVDDDGHVHLLFDLLFLLRYSLGSGQPPPAPGATGCGEDPTDDRLDCAAGREC